MINEEILCWHLGYKGMSKVTLMLQYYQAWRYDSTYSIDLGSGLECLLHNHLLRKNTAHGSTTNQRLNYELSL
jgi:hypothetical protein